jgi:molecular chaperone DnaK
MYSTERTLEEFAENVKDEDREGLLEAIDEAREAMRGDDSGVLRRAVDELSQLTYKMTENLYAELGGDDDGTARYAFEEPEPEAEPEPEPESEPDSEPA